LGSSISHRGDMAIWSKQRLTSVAGRSQVTSRLGLSEK
jgi:hypothetical protein